MSHRSLAAVLTALAVAVLAPAVAAAQSEVPRTAWGAPDLGGVWDFRSITPMERPDDLSDKAFLTEEEAARLEQETADRNAELLNRERRIRPPAGAWTAARTARPVSTTTSGWTAARPRWARAAHR